MMLFHVQNSINEIITAFSNSEKSSEALFLLINQPAKGKSQLSIMLI